MKPISQMTDTERNEAIAGLCGWHPTPQGFWTQNPSGIPTKNFPLTLGLPEYLTDLNACALMEATLTGNQLTVYDNVLYRVMNQSVSEMKFATARQRTTAFLMTHNFKL